MTSRDKAPRALERITSGSDRLDQILDGGIPRYSVVFVAGLPGTGKTVLSLQTLFANARQGRTGLYLSTISEPPIKVLRYLQGFAFFDPHLFGTRLIFGDLGAALRSHGAAGVIACLDDLVRDIRPDVVVIDSFKAIRDAVPDPLRFREFTLDLAVRLSTWEVTTLLVGEYAESDIHEGAEFAIADGIIYLYGTEEAEKQKRFVRIIKMRGTSFFAGEHLFDITSRGIVVYPRMAPVVGPEPPVQQGRIGSAIEGLSGMLDGGIRVATTTLISGATGTGKSLVALGFLIAAAHDGLPGLVVSFEEGSQQISRNARAFGWDVESLLRRRLLDIYHVSPSELDVDRHAFVVKDRADHLRAKLVLIDSISAFEAAVPSLAKYQSYLWAINDYFKGRGVTVIMTAEVRSIVGIAEVSARAISYIADNIIILRYVQVGSKITRVLGVLKTRGSRHDSTLRELIIDAPRIAIGSALQHAGILDPEIHDQSTTIPG
jgi:circadian clock protein KaiC